MKHIIAEITVRDVNIIVCPTRQRVVHMSNQQSAAGTAIVPPYLLTILQQIVLIFISWVAYNIGFTPSTQWFHSCNSGRFCQFLRLIPFHIDPLHGREVRRAPPSIDIVTAVHDIPFVGNRENSGRTQGIDVRQTQAMAELMAYHAETAYWAVVPKLTGNRIVIGINTTWKFIIKITRTWPDIPFCLISRVAGCNKQHLVYLTISIPVVDREVGGFCLA